MSHLTYYSLLVTRHALHDKNSKIFVAGATGLVGNAIIANDKSFDKIELVKRMLLGLISKLKK